MNLHVERGGAGESMLLLHGTGSELGAWAPVVDSLRARYDVLAVDMPGFGGTPAGPEEPTPLTLAAAVRTVMDGVGWQRAHLVGHSLGGFVALELAAQGRAITVNAVAPAGMATWWEWRWASSLFRAMIVLGRTLTPVVPTLAASPLARTITMTGAFAKPWRVDPATAEQAVRAFNDADVRRVLDATPLRMAPDRVGAVAVPVQLIWGTRDLVLLARQGQRWHDALRDAELRRLPGLGHTPMPEDPGAVAGAIIEFLDRRG